MIDHEIIEHFVRSKVLLQEKLSEIGKIPGSAEIESQMMCIENRMKDKVKRDVLYGVEEMNALRYILNEVAKPDIGREE